MKIFILHILITINLAFVINQSLAQPGTINMTPIVNSFGGLVSTKIKVPVKFAALIDSNKTVNIAQGFEPKIFYMGGLTKPRFMSFSPQGVLHVIDFKSNGSVYALPDANNDDIADTLLPVVTGVFGHDFRFYKGFIFVAEEKRILKCSDLNQDGFFETKEVFIDSIGMNSGGGHYSRTIVFDSINHKMYLSMGSPCNVCRDTFRSGIEQYNDDGSGRVVYATGIRNAVGLLVHPKTNQLWANNNGSDNQGNNIPPEWIDLIRPNGFYGFPFAYANQVWFNFELGTDYKALKPITAIDSAKVAKMVEPAGLIQAHSAPMDMEYVELTTNMQTNKGIVMALRGSWNRIPSTGYKLVFLSQNNSPDQITSVCDFLSGFLLDSSKSSGGEWARPVGLAIQKKGYKTNIFMSSDATNRFIMMLKDNSSTGFNELQKLSIKLYPNPFTHQIQIDGELPMDASITISNLLGQTENIVFDKETKTIDTKALSAGIYFIKIGSGNIVHTQKIIKIEG
ncbi:MAG: T9SS type A sorting domain-containing protein [Bacteroidota bacterium]|nr:T9SS type A sorting domain-containing protein [Bacteroidota bacterium]